MASTPSWRHLPLAAAAAGLTLAGLTLGSLALAQEPEPRTIDIVARRFSFDPAEVTATAGERIRLSITSADGVHGLEIKKFKIKQEVPRGGKAVIVDFTATEAGRFPILCSEYCGKDHDAMTGMLVVEAK